ncbi:MAG TPA: type II toxin-antitoxin system RelE/ParE family toxin, partial [Sphingomicrobium sp.]
DTQGVMFHLVFNPFALRRPNQARGATFLFIAVCHWIAARIVRVEAGLFGEVKSVGGKVSELRVDHGPGYRVYFTRRDGMLIILLCGGDKSTQAADIGAAQAMVAAMDATEKAAKKAASKREEVSGRVPVGGVARR